MGLLSKLSSTNLKSNKFGNDRFGNESSNQPYVVKGIPDELPINSPDILLRGGLTTYKDIANDVSRLTKYFTDTKSPNALIFTSKQNILSRLEVQSDAVRLNKQNIATLGGNLNGGIYLPTSTIAQAAINGLGGHLLKQGINVEPSDSNILSRILGDSTKLPKYSEVSRQISEIDNNRLVSFLSRFDNEPLYSYNGGPNSNAGIGKTYINRYKDYNESNGVSVKPEQELSTLQYLENVLNNNGNNLSVKYKNKYGIEIINDSTLQIYNSGSNSNQNIDYLLTQEQLITLSDNGSYNKKVISGYSDFRANGTINNIYPSINYFDYNIDKRLHQGTPGTKKESYDYSLPADSLEALDKINALPLYTDVKNKTVNDLVKFRIGIYHPNSNVKDYIHFRAFLDSFNDSFSGDIDTVKYSGRGEDLYTYKGFKRDISLSWTVVAQSKAELIPMYKKLNYLASTLAPTYNGAFMHGNIATLTIGGYLYEQPGYITGFSYDISEDSTWEIGIGTETNSDNTVKELPHIIKVSGFKFTPIHEFLPQRLLGTDSPDVNGTRFIALSNGVDDNYNDRYKDINLDSRYNNYGKI